MSSWVAVCLSSLVLHRARAGARLGGVWRRSVDDMLQVWLNVVYLDDAEYTKLVAERTARRAPTTGQQP